MAKGNRPLAMEAPGVGAPGREMMGHPFDGSEVRRAWSLIDRGETQLSS